MPDETTILSLPLILPAQAQKHVTHNEALVELDLIVQLAVTSRTLTAPPALPAVGDRYIVAAGPTGDWAGHAGRIALYSETSWQFTQALPGWRAHILAEGQTAVFDGLVWRTPAEGALTVAELGVSATPDANNRLAVASPGSLFNHVGQGHQLKVNKATVTDTASLLFQTGFQGRVEMGTAGEDNFSIKVSPDGIDWPTAFSAAVETGAVTFPQPVHLGGQDSDPIAPPDGTLWLNTTTGEVRLRSAGVTQTVGGGGVSDGDKGDITVTGSGATWTIDPGAVTLAKLATIATDSFLGRDTPGTGTPEVLTPVQARGILNIADGANNYVHPNHTGEVTSTGDGVTVIANNAVTNARLADMATARIKGRGTAGTGDPEDLTATEVTALLDLFTTVTRGLAPPSGGGTANFLRADGTWAAPLAGGAPGGASGELQFNNAGAFAGAADAEIEDGQLRLPYIATPATPAAGGVKLYGTDFGPGGPAFLLPSGRVKLIQSDLGEFNVQRYVPVAGLSTLVGENSLNLTAVGTATAATPAITRLHTMMPRLDILVAVAATTAIAAYRPTAAAARFLRVGRDANAPGGFLLRTMWGPTTGVATATNRAFCGLADWTANPTDVEPSTRTNIIGMGWDAADANIQFLHNDAAGVATKIDLGAGFPVPTVDREQVYEVQLYSPNDLAQSVSYRVIRYSTTDKTIAAEATGTVVANLPMVTTLLGPCGAISVGGTSSVIGQALMGILVAREY